MVAAAAVVLVAAVGGLFVALGRSSKDEPTAPTVSVTSTIAALVADDGAPSATAARSATGAPSTTAARSTVAGPGATTVVAVADAVFPAVPGAAWTTPPDAMRAQLNALLGGVDPSHTFTKSADLRYLQFGGHQVNVVRYELQDSAVDPATFREQFIKGFLFKEFTSRAVGATDFYLSETAAGHFVVFGGRDRACWMILDPPADTAYDAAVAIVKVVGGMAR